MRKITVTYTLTTSQEQRLKRICDHLRTKGIEEQLEYMMQLSSVQDINNKLTFFETFHNLEKE